MAGAVTCAAAGRGTGGLERGVLRGRDRRRASRAEVRPPEVEWSWGAAGIGRKVSGLRLALLLAGAASYLCAWLLAGGSFLAFLAMLALGLAGTAVLAGAVGLEALSWAYALRAAGAARRGRLLRAARLQTKATLVAPSRRSIAMRERAWTHAVIGPSLRIRHRQADVTAVAFSGEGEVCATGSSDGSVKVRDLKDLAVVWSLDVASAVLSLAFSPDAGELAVGNAAGEVVVLDRTVGRARKETLHRFPVVVAAYAPDGTLFTVASDGGLLYLPGSPHLMRRIDPRARAVTCVEVDRSCRRLLVCAADGTVTVWDILGEGQRIAAFVQEGRTPSAAFSPDGGRIVSCAGGELCLWDIDTYSRLARWRAGDAVARVRFGPDGNTVLASSPGQVCVLAADGLEGIVALAGLEGPAPVAAAAPAGRTVVAGSRSGELAAWRLMG